jgi:MoaA/NifB/PqqE/SkfB family radical SAM enzyme
MANRIYGTKSGVKNLLLRAAGKKRIFYASSEVTSRCNSRCLTCPIWRMKKVYEPSLAHEKLIIDRFREAGVLIAVFTGGEPLMRKDIPEILKHSYEQGLITCMVTNGLLLSKRLDEISSYVDRIVVSLDSSKPDVHNRIRGIKVFDRAIEGIRKARSKGVEVVINSVISKSNLGDVEEILYLGERLGASGVAFDPLQKSFYGASFGNLAPGIKERPLFEEKIRLLMKLKKQGHLVMNSMPYLKFLLEPDNFRENCDVYGVKADWHGRIVPLRCERAGNKSYGIESRSINRILDSDEVRKSCEEIRYCRDCSISCVWDPVLTLSSLSGFCETMADIAKKGYWRMNAGRPSA